MAGANYMGGKRNAAKARTRNVALRTQKNYFGRQRLDNLARSLTVAGKLTAPSASARPRVDISASSNSGMSLFSVPGARAGIELAHAKRAPMGQVSSPVQYFIPEKNIVSTDAAQNINSVDSSDSRGKQIRSSKVLSTLDESEPLFLRATLDKISNLPDLAGLSSRATIPHNTAQSATSCLGKRSTASYFNNDHVTKRQRISSSRSCYASQLHSPDFSPPPTHSTGSSSDQETDAENFSEDGSEDISEANGGPIDPESRQYHCTSEPAAESDFYDNWSNVLVGDAFDINNQVDNQVIPSARWLLSDTNTGYFESDSEDSSSSVVVSLPGSSLPASSLPSFHTSDCSPTSCLHLSSPSSLGLRYPGFPCLSAASCSTAPFTLVSTPGFQPPNGDMNGIEEPSLAIAPKLRPGSSKQNNTASSFEHDLPNTNHGVDIKNLFDYEDPWKALDVILDLPRTAGDSRRLEYHSTHLDTTVSFAIHGNDGDAGLGDILDIKTFDQQSRPILNAPAPLGPSALDPISPTSGLFQSGTRVHCLQGAPHQEGYLDLLPQPLPTARMLNAEPTQPIFQREASCHGLLSSHVLDSPGALSGSVSPLPYHLQVDLTSGRASPQQDVPIHIDSCMGTASAITAMQQLRGNRNDSISSSSAPPTHALFSARSDLGICLDLDEGPLGGGIMEMECDEVRFSQDRSAPNAIMVDQELERDLPSPCPEPLQFQAHDRMYLGPCLFMEEDMEEDD